MYMSDEIASVDSGAVDQVSGDSQSTQGDQESAVVAEAAKEIDLTSIDPNTLSPELQELHKSLLGDYTRKTQEISTIKGQADAFNELANQPGFAEVLANLEKYGTFTAPAEEQKPVQQMNGEEILTKILEDPNWLTNKIREEAQALNQPILEREGQREASSTIEKLTAKYPDFPEYSNDIAKKIEQSGFKMDPEDAYKALAFDKSYQKGANEATKVTQDRINAAGTKGSSAQVTQPQVFKTINEAFQAAKKQHGK